MTTYISKAVYIAIESSMLSLFIKMVYYRYMNDELNITEKSLDYILCIIATSIFELLSTHSKILATILSSVPVIFLLNYVFGLYKEKLLYFLCITSIYSFATHVIIFKSQGYITGIGKDHVPIIITQLTTLILSNILVMFIIYNLIDLHKKEINISEAISNIICFFLIISIVLKCLINIKEKNVMFSSLDIIQIILSLLLVVMYKKYKLSYVKNNNSITDLKIYNHNLSETSDSLRLVKHDYNNILQAINGYVVTKEYSSLASHMKKLTCRANNLKCSQSISPTLINQPAIYGIVGEKYLIAKNKDIKFNLDILSNVSDISFDFTELSRVIGILLDNAIEASQKSKTPEIWMNFSFNNKKQADIIEIKNTMLPNNDISASNLFEKGVSSKKVKSGLGLWEVKKILSSKDNSQIYTNIDKNIFTQTIVIEKV